LSESPLVTLARVLAGIVLMQGRLGHQVLGQLLVMNTNEVALAGAALVVAATTGERSAVGQMALRTVAPAVAVRILLDKQERRLEQKSLRLAERERALGTRKATLETQHSDMRLEMDSLHAEMDRVQADMERRLAEARKKPPRARPRRRVGKKKR
jgi:hypothetical protein